MNTNQSHDYNKEALDLHEINGGKIETKVKVNLETRDDLSRAYSPGVGAVCVEIGNGDDKEFSARKYTLKRNTVAIVSDGSAILGLGNLGAEASIPVMEGKSAILKSFANVDAFPICIKSQNTEDIINTIKNISPVFGGINLEDISAPRCFEIEERLKKELNIPVMHDDQWGAATVTLTAFINSLRIVNKQVDTIKVVISGVGAAGVATGRLLNAYGVKNIIYVDSKGIINKTRETDGELNKEKIELLNSSNIQELHGDLSTALIGADVFIGLSKPGVVTSDMVKSMNSDPVIFALANPVPEIMPEVAISSGARIVATGRSDYLNQVNNSLVFPGFWRGVLDAQFDGTYKKIVLETFIKIAKSLADHVTDINENNILPNMFDKECVEIVASAVRG